MSNPQVPAQLLQTTGARLLADTKIAELIIRGICTGSLACPQRTITPIIKITYKYIAGSPSGRKDGRHKYGQRAGVVTKHSLIFPQDLNPKFTPLPLGLPNSMRQLYEQMWPDWLYMDYGPRMKFSGDNDVVYMDHNQLYLLWDYWMKYHHDKGPGYGLTNWVHRNVRSKFKHFGDLPETYEDGNLEGLDAIRRLHTTLKTINLGGVWDLFKSEDLGQPLKGVTSVRFNWPQPPYVIYTADMVKEVHSDLFAAQIVSLSSQADLSITKTKQKVMRNIDYFFEELQGGETDDDELDNEGYAVNARVKGRRQNFKHCHVISNKTIY